MSGLHLLSPDGGEEADGFRVNGRLFGYHNVSVDVVKAMDSFDELVRYGDVIHHAVLYTNMCRLCYLIMVAERSTCDSK